MYSGARKMKEGMKPGGVSGVGVQLLQTGNTHLILTWPVAFPRHTNTFPPPASSPNFSFSSFPISIPLTFSPPSITLYHLLIVIYSSLATHHHPTAHLTTSPLPTPNYSALQTRTMSSSASSRSSGRARRPPAQYGNPVSSDQAYGSDDDEFEDPVVEEDEEDESWGRKKGGGEGEEEEGAEDEDEEDEDEAEFSDEVSFETPL